jgi:hypothetical protein
MGTKQEAPVAPECLSRCWDADFLLTISVSFAIEQLDSEYIPFGEFGTIDIVA